MPDEVVPGASADSPPSSDAPAESSTAPVVDGAATPSGQASPPPSQEPKPPWNMPPEERWQEVLRQRDEARQQAQAAMELARQAQGLARPPATPQADPLAGLVNHPDPATAQFWQQVKAVAEAIAEQKAQALTPQMQHELSALRAQQAALAVAQFRRENPEIAPNSPEEQAIIARLNHGYPLEEAKRIVMYDVLTRKLSQHASTQAQRQAAQKRLASPEAGPGLPAHAGQQPKGSFRETMDAELKAAGF